MVKGEKRRTCPRNYRMETDRGGESYTVETRRNREGESLVKQPQKEEKGGHPQFSNRVHNVFLNQIPFLLLFKFSAVALKLPHSHPQAPYSPFSLYIIPFHSSLTLQQTHIPKYSLSLSLSLHRIMVCQKKLVDEVSGWLRIFDDGSVDRTWTGPPEVKFMAESVPPHEDFLDGVATRDVVADPNSGLKVRIYLPEKKADSSYDKMPVVIHFHGGGFCISRADWYMYYSTYAKLAASAGAIVVSVYLRLAPEHRLPAPCHDGYAALLWLRSLARGDSHEEWLNSHADFTRVFLIGDSSGGNIVHQVASMAGDADLSPVKLAGAIPIHPGFVRVERSKSELEHPESPFLTLDMVDKFLSFALPVGCNKEHPITCPMGEAAPPLQGLRLPPVLLCVAEKDLILDTEMEYYEAMQKSGQDVELVESSGMGHSFYLNRIAVKVDPHTAQQTQKLFAAISDFIHKH